MNLQSHRFWLSIVSVNRDVWECRLARTGAQSLSVSVVSDSAELAVLWETLAFIFQQAWAVNSVHILPAPFCLNSPHIPLGVFHSPAGPLAFRRSSARCLCPVASMGVMLCHRTPSSRRATSWDRPWATFQEGWEQVAGNWTVRTAVVAAMTVT